MKTLPPVHRIALLFNGSKIYDRGIIAGIGNYLSSTRASWDLFLEEDFLCRLKGIERWQGDGIIADFDDPLIGEALAGSKVPVVAVGGSYEDARAYPKGIPYVATDNDALMKMAYAHLIEAGLTRFACFSLPEAQANRWAQEREKAFKRLMQRDGLPVQIYRGLGTSAPLWDSAVEQQIAWLQSLPKPIGIIAVTDARARQLLQACLTAGIAVPEEVALIGIDNDPLTRTLTRVPLSSVIQGTETMGRTAAALLHQMLHGKPCEGTQVLVPPDAINVQASSLHQPLGNPYVMQALLFIRQYACQGIKTAQVAAYVGVSRSSLESHFRKARGCSVHDEILRFKLANAAKGLQGNHLAIADIAQQCGFKSAQYLHTVFRREFGCTPREYQQSH
ncbi:MULTISPECIES: XylR family transcriptional regulator [Pseudomonas]|uniref:XylR family transcriptional regulator n=1 Tax=Pseudomonas tritici TaxID=2745518 RepID=A0A8I0D0H4_9PSED|nr:MULTISPECIES: XylR family transcriptional regulator [Pseudomonas]MBP2871619.1 XylR family transcriptional regulator [Pseudomonas sp. SWRI144]MBW8129869.1 XylR family transcriptional regulator [Pseudomonas sp. LAP_36]MBW8138900.1 XylR family transcriptional regulator [Pseudomonas sp. PAMC 26818]QXH86126.1 XylR family transcriptional regulator [Pseudomonas tritici]CRM12710.1 Xylose operon regulatory protein [Pseudomonas sp. 35 E 8]